MRRRATCFSLTGNIITRRCNKIAPPQELHFNVGAHTESSFHWPVSASIICLNAPRAIQRAYDAIGGVVLVEVSADATTLVSMLCTDRN